MKPILLLLIVTILLNAADTLRVYISADRTSAKESGLSIEQGIRTALSTCESTIDSIYLDVQILDHRGSTPRFVQHCEQFIEDEQALVMVGGLHSPPLLAQRTFINEKKILTLVPWAAAGPITRYPQKENWIFRLSIDDSKAGNLIADYAVKEGFKKPVLLLEETGWGRSNENTMTKALAKHGITPLKIEWFNWNIGEHQARVILRNLHQIGADVIFFVGNAPEGESFAKAMAALSTEERIPIRSHWGITGGDFAKVITSDIRDSLDLLFIQSSFSFLNQSLSQYAESVFSTAAELYKNELTRPEDIEAPTGFIHAYDITLLLIEAMKQCTYNGDIAVYRNDIRKALENLETPVQGLVKKYRAPFTEWSKENSDAHEALNLQDWRMARYRSDNTIELIREKR